MIFFKQNFTLSIFFCHGPYFLNDKLVAFAENFVSKLTSMLFNLKNRLEFITILPFEIFTQIFPLKITWMNFDNFNLLLGLSFKCEHIFKIARFFLRYPMDRNHNNLIRSEIFYFTNIQLVLINNKRRLIFCSSICLFIFVTHFVHLFALQFFNG